VDPVDPALGPVELDPAIPEEVVPKRAPVVVPAEVLGPEVTPPLVELPPAAVEVFPAPPLEQQPSVQRSAPTMTSHFMATLPTFQP